MSGIGFVADVHVGNHKKIPGSVEAGMNYRCRETIATLNRAYSKAIDLGLCGMVICGDLFDTSRPSPAMIRSIQKVVSRLKTVVLVGNHDLDSDAPNHNAVSPLKAVARVIEKPEAVEFPNGQFVLCVPFLPGDAKDWFEREVTAFYDMFEGTFDALCFHLGVRDGKTQFFLKEARDCVEATRVARVMKKMNIPFAAAGNWHDYRRWNFKDGRTIVQCGAIVPTGWDNPGLKDYGFLNILRKSGDIERVEIPGPRFIKVASEDDIPSDLGEDFSLYVKWSVDDDSLGGVQSVLDELQTQKIIRGGMAAHSKAKVKNVAKEATDKIRSSRTLEEALAMFIKSMDIPNSRVSNEVHKRCQDLLQLREKQA